MAYSEENFGKMQEEAVRRVMEMQQRSRDAVGQAPPPLPEKDEEKPVQEQSLLNGLTGGIKIDEEKALIGLLIFILYKQGADVRLLLALGYLLL
ncbi:hypothetical protein [Ruminococcus sp.]|uniref:hypothetical protein n=1 Tax=Ruminococcus sp. TaxID=41978 RepID=UPI0025FE869E|nr:hypothetical protein [Ruminococcus sp.]MBQ8967323.1 hypothetical protein [Ruminococcus sp.]